MRAVKQGLLWALATAASAASEAGTVHHVRFAQPAQILVWENGDLIAHGDRIQLSDRAVSSAPSLLGTGALVPVEDAARGQRIISVASNTAFSLSANPGESVTVRLLEARENAQARADGATGVLFRQVTKTAVRPGAPTSQAIELEISWSGDHAPVLTLTAD